MGGSYNVRFSNAIVMQGNIYYQEAYGNSGGGGDYVAVNIQTGKELWRINATATGVSHCSVIWLLYSFDSGNQHGVLTKWPTHCPDQPLLVLEQSGEAMTQELAYSPR